MGLALGQRESSPVSILYASRSFASHLISCNSYKFSALLGKVLPYTRELSTLPIILRYTNFAREG